MRRYSRIVVLTLALLPAAAVAASAQQDTARVRVRVRTPESGEGRTFTYMMGPENFQLDMRRGRLGITVDLRADARDSIGARVAGVTPGGPAERAGVQTGDIITRFNGTRLAVAEGGNEEADQSRPGMRLINLASRLEQGDTVRLDLRREARTLTVTFQAAETDMDVLVERMRIPGNGQMMLREFGGAASPFGGETPGGSPMRMLMSGRSLSDLELVKVSPQLAEGLGISEGLLVVDVGSDTSIGVRAGDVIVSIGGRRPSSPPHAMRILSTYDAGEAVQFEVMRQRRRITVNGRMPAAGHSEWRIRPNNFEFSLPRMPAEPMMRMFEQDAPRIHGLIKLEGKV
jgi:membrane-associated protease RseP (regulator of RpoE activity)